jgi:hypothetical protein
MSTQTSISLDQMTDPEPFRLRFFCEGGRPGVSVFVDGLTLQVWTTDPDRLQDFAACLINAAIGLRRLQTEQLDVLAADGAA